MRTTRHKTLTYGKPYLPGKWKFYNENGTLIMKVVYKNGMRIKIINYDCTEDKSYKSRAVKIRQNIEHLINNK